MFLSRWIENGTYFWQLLLLQHSIQRHPLARAIHNGIFKADILVKIKFSRRRWINRDTLDRDSFVGRLGQVNSETQNTFLCLCANSQSFLFAAKQRHTSITASLSKNVFPLDNLDENIMIAITNLLQAISKMHLTLNNCVKKPPWNTHILYVCSAFASAFALFLIVIYYF